VKRGKSFATPAGVTREALEAECMRRFAVRWGRPFDEETRRYLVNFRESNELPEPVEDEARRHYRKMRDAVTLQHAGQRRRQTSPADSTPRWYAAPPRS
jgi:hypothetical protein